MKKTDWTEKETSKNTNQNQLDIPVVSRLLSNDIMYEKSELHGSSIGDNHELCRDSIKITSFEIGFMCAKKLILEYLKKKIIMEKNEIKKALYKQKPEAKMIFIRNNIAYYCADLKEKRVDFEVPVNDMGNADFLPIMDAKHLIRWLVE